MEQMPAVEACLCSRQDAVAAYARLSGRDMSDFLFHRVLAMYKLSVIFLQLGLRYRTGATQEPRYAPLAGDRHRHSGIHPRDRPRTRILMDFSLSPELQELQQRTRAFIRDKIIPLEGDERQTHHGPTEEFRRELVALAARRGPGGAACRRRIRRAGAVACRQGGGVRGSRLFAAGTGGDAHLRARRRQHAPAGGRCFQGTEGALAAAAGVGRDAVVLLHDGAGAGGGVGPGGAGDDGGEGRQPLRHQRRQMVHHRRRRGGVRHHHGEGRGRPRDDVPGRHGHAGDRDRAAMDSLDTPSPAATRWCGSPMCACRPAIFWASRARGSATRRCAWRRRG